jgi:uncharacterized membrane protein YjjP (DUF1212 family)
VARDRPDERAAARTLVQRRRVIEFLTELGGAMSCAGDATTFITKAIERSGTAYGLKDLRVSAGPTLLILRYADDELAFVDLTTTRPLDLRLDQVSEIYQLVSDAESGKIAPELGRRRLHEILRRPSRSPAAVRIAGQALLAGGISLVLTPSLPALVVSMALGVLVGALRALAGRVPAVWPLVPVVCASLVAAIGFQLIDAGVDASVAALLLPPLAIFLPGATITVSMIELSAGDIVSGGSRLASGSARLLLLVLGIVIASQSINVGSLDTTFSELPFPPLWQMFGVVAFTAGVCLQFDAPRGSFPWLLLVVLAAWGAQQLSSVIAGSYLSAALAGGVMVVVAQLVAVRPGAPPLIVSYTPAFWLLVPGALGLKSLTDLAQDAGASAISDLLLMILTMVAIALGMLVGLLLSGNRHMYESR